MSNGGLSARVIAWGVPALLIILGFMALTGSKITEAIFGTSEGMATIGVIMIIVGIGLYILEKFIGF